MNEIMVGFWLFMAGVTGKVAYNMFLKCKKEMFLDTWLAVAMGGMAGLCITCITEVVIGVMRIYGIS